MATCIHGGDPRWCAICNGSLLRKKAEAAKKRKPKHTKQAQSVRSSGAVKKSPVIRNGEVIVITKQRDHRSWNDVTKDTVLVHFSGIPLLWAVEKVLEKAPNLKVLQIIPSSVRWINDPHRELLRERGVELRLGHWRPENAWKKLRVPPNFPQRQAFLMELEGEQKELFEELLLLGFPEAEMASQYYCLDGEELVTQEDIGSQYGYEKATAVNQANRHINGVLRYLDPTFETSRDAMAKAEAIKNRVAKFRVLAADQAVRVEELKKLRLSESDLPKELPWARLEIFAAVRELYKSKQLARKLRDKRKADVLIRRFGLESGVCETLLTIGNSYGVTRERVRQVESQALSKLGLIDNE